MKIFNHKSIFTLSLILAMLACSLPRGADTPAPTETPIPTTLPATETPIPAMPTPELTATPLPPSQTPIPPTPTKIPHALVPSTNVELSKLTVVDAVSVDTAAEMRAPYGDLYKYNWFERPFLQDMTYVADLDIASYNLSYDQKFYYVSIELVGANPNNPLGINYGVELDLDADGFGDYIVIAHPPYDVDWSADNVQVVEDTNQDTGGASAELSDAPFPGDGYDTVIFDGGRGADDDPDLAWVRINAGRKATVQFAFKRYLAEDKFMYGVIADAGLKSIADMDYVDRYTEEEAGSPEKNEKFYPLKALFGVDNVCREVFGFKGNRQEPQRCRPK